MPNRMFLRLSLLLKTLALLVVCQSCTWLKPSVETGAVLFQDDFSRVASGWDRYIDDTYVTDYADGAYRIGIFTPETSAWARPHLEFSDVRIQVSATKADGSDNNVFGVLCRYQDSQNFYFFLISSDGYSGIGVYRDGDETLISGDSMLPSEAILQGSTTNNIQAECIGDVLTLYINGVQEVQVQTTEWSQGDVGLIAGTYTQPGTEILFERFSVIKP